MLDPGITLQRLSDSYIEVVQTPLLGKMTSNSISRVIRGPTQFLKMEPAKYSIDPDFPDVLVIYDIGNFCLWIN